mgnify:CR=1 FL=1
MRLARAVASLAADAAGKCRGERIGVAEHVSAVGDGWIGGVAEDAFACHLSSKPLVLGVIESR